MISWPSTSRGAARSHDPAAAHHPIRSLHARRCPDGAAARNQRTVNSQRPPALDRSRDGRRRHRAVLSLLLRRDGGGRDRARAGRRVEAVAGDRLAPLDVRRNSPGDTGSSAFRASSGWRSRGWTSPVWDALSIAAGLPLVSFLGGSPRPIPAYNSNGLGLMAPEKVADEAEELLEQGFRAVKLRLGRADARRPGGGSRGAPASARRVAP